MSIVLNGQVIEVGTKLRFRTLASSDGVVWNGYVEAIARYPVARIVSDVARMHNEVLKDVPGLTPMQDQEYIILSTSDTDDPSIKVAFAIEWIDESTVAVIEVGNRFDIRIYDEPDANLAVILQLLAENGFKAKLIS
jgi:hypothetical protein